MVEKIYYEGAPSPRLLIKWVFTILIPYAITLGIVWSFIVGFIFIMNASFEKFIPTVTLGFISISILITIYLFFLVTTYEYKITDEGAHYSGGILTKKYQFVPFNKITNISISQDMLQLILDISDLNIQISGTKYEENSEIVFEGLADPDEPRNILEVYIADASSHRFYNKHQKALRDLKSKKIRKEIAEGKHLKNQSREKNMLKFEERIHKKISAEKKHIKREDLSTPEVYTLEELFKKWKNGEINTKEYLRRKKSSKGRWSR